MTIPTSDELKRLARAMDLLIQIYGKQFSSQTLGEAVDIHKVIAAFANVSADEPERWVKGDLDQLYFNPQYADHWHDKAMQLAVRVAELELALNKIRELNGRNIKLTEQLRQQLAEAQDECDAKLDREDGKPQEKCPKPLTISALIYETKKYLHGNS